MKVLILGGGPGGLYSGSLIKKTHPDWDITLIERNPHDATYGWGVVFSDRTLSSFREADYPSYRDITNRFVVWDTIEVRYRGETIRCGGNIFAGISRKVLLMLLQERCRAFGVKLKFLTEIRDVADLKGYDLVIAADGVNSIVRRTWADEFKPSIVMGNSRFAWLGTHKVFDAFTFSFRRNEHGLFQAHVYPNDGLASTFIVQCDPETWRRAGLDRASEAETVAYCERVFAADLNGEPLLANKSDWVAFSTVSNKTWRYQNMVLIGDAAHTADFTVGSGTKMAMEDAIALANAFERYGENVDAALNDYELERRPMIEGIQRAAAESNRYFETTTRYEAFEPMQFIYYLLTRSGRISYDELRRRDSAFVDAMDRWFYASTTGTQAPNLRIVAPPPMLAPLHLRGLTLHNRVAAPAATACTARDGVPDEAYTAELRNLTQSGAALIMTDLLAIAPEARITPGCSGLYRPEHAAMWSRLAKMAHDQQTRIAARLAHAGRRGATRPRNQGLDLPLREGGWPLLSASAIPFLPDGQVPKEMDRADMERVRDQFVRAAQMANETGFDLLELYFAHGYLAASFLSPLTNRRRDNFGGSLENRMRYPLEILDAVREVWPETKPLCVALSATDWAKGGLQPEDAVAIVLAMKERGADLFDIVAGQTTLESQPVYGPYFLTSFSDQVRNEAHVPTLTSGDITSTDQVNNIVAAGRADLCLMEPPRLNAHYRIIGSGPAADGR
ncbi:MAG TPA: FAD-dependent monooxygenase [Candidatus Binataceae bacterium]|nr:FAD-dependent monooxygenase [Candidatus Binataceae bacterium]